MIKVTFYTNDDSIIGFESLGHARYNDDGRDIVCSAVSALTINCENALDKLTNDHLTVKEDEKKGLIKLFVFNPSKEAKLLLRSYELGITAIYQQYEEYVSIGYKEVKPC